MMARRASCALAIAAAGLLAACGTAPRPPAAQPAAGVVAVGPAQSQKVDVSMRIVRERLAGLLQPRFTNAAWSSRSGALKVGRTVRLTIVSQDVGPAPPPAAYGRVRGTVGGVEQVDGKAVSSLTVKDIAYTFTIPALNLNIPIPAAPKGGSVTVVAMIPLTKAGTFDWQCFSPCGSGQGGWAGAMVLSGWMRGAVTIGA